MAMLRVHLLQNWFGYSDPAMKEALYETTILRRLAGLSPERGDQVGCADYGFNRCTVRRLSTKSG